MKFSMISFFAFLLTVGLSTQSMAAVNNCTKTYATKSGTVMPAGPAKMTFKPDVNTITVEVNKTKGKAQTIVNIYVNNQRKAYMTFTNGKYSKKMTKRVSGVKNKNVRVEIVNQSVGNKFTYSAKATGLAGSNLGSENGNPAPQAQKRVTFDKVCKNRINIKLVRTQGKARANVFIYKGNTQVWNGIFDKNDTRLNKSFSGAAGKTFSVVVKNVSVGNRIRFTASATQ